MSQWKDSFVGYLVLVENDTGFQRGIEMKLVKTFSFFLCILLVLVSVGCKKDKDSGKGGDQSSTVESPSNSLITGGKGKLTELSIDSGSVIEGDEGTMTLSLTVTCSAQPRKNRDIQVHWSTADAEGTSSAKATVEEDYISDSGVLTFKYGESLQQQITVSIKSDVVAEDDEIFLVTLQQPINASIANSVGEVLIKNDDDGMPKVSNDTKFANLPNGTIIADHFNDLSQKDYNGNAEYSIVSVSGQPFTEAIQVEIKSEPSSDSRVNMTIDSPILLHEGDVVLTSFYARTISPASNGSGHLEFLLQHDSDPWTEYVIWPLDIGAEWKRYYLPVTVQVWRGMRSEVYLPPPSDGNSTTFGVGEVRFRFSLGYHPQILQLADMRIVDYGNSVAGPDLPVTLLPTKEGNVIIPGNTSGTVEVTWKPKLLDEAEAGNVYLPDFSYAGYHNGEGTLPTGKGATVIDVTAEPYKATPNDDTDDTEAIKQAIAAADNISGPVVLTFPPGRFIVSEVIVIKRDDFILQGAGSQAGGTILVPLRPMKDMVKLPLIQSIEQQIISSDQRTSRGVLYSPFSWAGGVLWIGTPEAHGDTGATGTITRTIGTADRGGHSVLTEDASSLTPGQVVQLRYYDNSSANPLYDHIFDCTASDLPEGYGSSLSEEPEVRQSITVKSVSGNTVTFKEPLNHDIREGWFGELKTLRWFSEIGIDGIAIEFSPSNYAGHHIEEGYNGIYFNDSLNCWVNDVKILNADSGVLVENSKNVTVSNVVVSGRGGHYALMAVDSDQVLFRDFDSDNRSCHSLSFNTNARTIVYTHGRVEDPTFDQHNGMNHQNLLDDLDVVGEVRHLWEHGGDSSRRPTHGAFNTAWNLRFSPVGKVPALGTFINDGPSAYMVGLTSDAVLMFRYGPSLYTEGIGRDGITVPSLYEYQLTRRLSATDQIQE